MGQQAHIVDYDAHGRYDYNCGGTTFFTGPAPGPSVCKRCDQPLVKRTALDTAIAAAKRDLAQKVLTAIKVVNIRLVLRSADGAVMRQSIVAGLQRLFAAEGIEPATTQQQEGE